MHALLKHSMPPMLICVAAVMILSTGCISRYPQETLSTRVWKMPRVTELTREETPAASGAAQPPAVAQQTLAGQPTVDGQPAQAAAPAEDRTLVARVIRPNGFPENELAVLDGKQDLGIVFSGGGNRAATCALGQVRALTELKIMQKARYISCISGGSWFCVPYTFSQIKDDLFLGKNTDPKELTPHEIAAMPEAGSFAWRACHASAPVLASVTEFHGNENYAHRLNKIYLSHLDGTNHEHRYFCYDNQTRDDIIRRNPALSAEDFLVAAAGRPYLIASTAIALPDRFRPSQKFAALVEMTPNYTGSPAYRAGSILSAPIGGGFVESFAYDSKIKSASQSQDGYAATVELPRRRFIDLHSSPRFSLSDVMASSGAAPSIIFENTANLLGFPRLLHWSPERVLDKRQTRNFTHSDGGAIDNTGVIPMLRRRVKNLIVFVNLGVKFQGEGADQTPELPDDVAALFMGQHQAFFKSQDISVFGPADYIKLRSAFEQKWRDRAPLIIQEPRPYTTIYNRRFGVAKGLQVKITWVFLGGYRPAEKEFMAATPPQRGRRGSLMDWLCAIPRETLGQVMNSGPLKDFPYYKTFFQNGSKVINLSPTQVNALSQYTSYTVLANKELFRKAAE